MTATHDTTTTEETTIDLSTMNEEELTKLQEAATFVLEVSKSELGLADLADHADDIVAGTVSFIQEELMPPAAQMLFNAAADLLEGDKGPQDRLAYVLYLDALIASPEAVQASLRALRDALVKNDPALALVK